MDVMEEWVVRHPVLSLACLCSTPRDACSCAHAPIHPPTHTRTHTSAPTPTHAYTYAQELAKRRQAEKLNAAAASAAEQHCMSLLGLVDVGGGWLGVRWVPLLERSSWRVSGMRREQHCTC